MYCLHTLQRRIHLPCSYTARLCHSLSRDLQHCLAHIVWILVLSQTICEGAEDIGPDRRLKHRATTGLESRRAGNSRKFREEGFSVRDRVGFG